MLKKTTIYLEEAEIETLKRISFMQNTSMTELIRMGIQKLCSSFSKDEIKALEAMGELRAATSTSGLTSKQVMREVLTAQKNVRRERKKSSR